MLVKLLKRVDNIINGVYKVNMLSILKTRTKNEYCFTQQNETNVQLRIKWEKKCFYKTISSACLELVSYMVLVQCMRIYIHVLHTHIIYDPVIEYLHEFMHEFYFWDKSTSTVLILFHEASPMERLIFSSSKNKIILVALLCD